MTDFTTLATTLGRDASDKLRSFAETSPVAHRAKDAVYTIVGLGVMSVQKINIATHKVTDSDLANTVDERTQQVVGNAKKSATDGVATLRNVAERVSERFDNVVTAVDFLIAPYEEKLPHSLRNVSAKARSIANEAHGLVKSKITQADDAVSYLSAEETPSA
jgi:hypothetical protein